jgi:RNA recognition motif-containing protein
MNKIVCRKCGGEHLTIKCGKEQVKPVPELVSYKQEHTRPRYRHDNLKFNKTYTIKLSELPLDITEPELYELLENWGHVTKIKVMLYTESSTAYIDFSYKEEAEYFVEAIHKTPFDSYIINAELCVDRR